jgi:cell division protein FtsI (penicillin-binding protein 3)
MRVDRVLNAFRSHRFPLHVPPAEDGPDAAFERSWRQSLRQRVFVVLSCVAVWVVAVQARLIQLQVFQHDELEARARRHQEQRVPLEATRGDIVDRHGQVLAFSVEARSIVADPSLVVDPEKTAARVCAALGDCLTKERKELEAKLTRSTRYEVIRRSQAVSPEQVERIAALELPGIVTPSDSRRYYPRYELGAHVLGFVGRDSRGQGGVEYAYDQLVRGQDGLAFAQVDAKRQRLESRIERPPVPGSTLELTLDLQLQYIAERELKAGVEAHRARGGTAIIMAPSTGEILALASYPTFNPNVVSRSSDDDRRNRATQDVYEPGSTFKIVTASAALEEGVVTPAEVVDTRPGYIKIGSRIIDDDHKYGVMSFEDVIVKSSNVGAIKVGLRTGVDRLSRYVHRFGFGEVLARDFAGQSRGIWNPNGLDESGLASVSMGYQVGVTPLQMVTAVSAVANGGLLLQPRIVRSVLQNGRREETSPIVVRRAISQETAATLTAIMEGVVSNRGTARQAILTHYQAAGKTGTAKKIVNNRYSDTDYNASFVGFVPSRRPVFTILVVVDTPRAGTYYGGSVAAPIFKRIAEAALQQVGVPSTVNPPPPVLVSAATPRLPMRIASSIPPSLVAAVSPVGDTTVMPDVTGLSAREAVRKLTAVGLTVRPRGSGFVARQHPAPGEPVDPGSWGLLDLQRTIGAVDARGPR